MTARFNLLTVSGVLGSVVLVSSLQGARPTLEAAPRALPSLTSATASGEDAAASTWFCAAGTAQDGGLADHTVVVANPTGHPVDGVLTVFTGAVSSTTAPASGSEPIERPFTVPANDRASFRLADIRSAPLAAALVEADSGAVAVEHQLAGPFGRDRSACAAAAASSWHFAWGSTSRDARELLVLFNPFPSDVTVDGSFSTEAGARQPLRWQGLTVPARSVVGVEVGEDVTRRGQVAASVRARGGRLVVDRVQAFDGSVGPKGLSVSLGQPEAAQQWMFAHGRVNDRAGERIVLYNPGSRTAEVDVAPQGMADPRPAAPFGVVVRPGQVEVLDYGAEARVARQVGHATAVQSRNGVPIVAERVMSYDNDLSGRPGSRFAASRWVFPLVDEAGDQTSRFAVVNPDRERLTRVSFDLHGSGARSRPEVLQEIDVPPGGRVEVDLSGAVPPGAAASVMAASTRPVVVERVVVEDQRDIAAGPGVPLP